MALAAALLWLLLVHGRLRGGRQAGQADIYVAAVRDSRLLTMCADVREVTFANGRTWKADGRAVARPSSDDTQTVALAGRAAASEREVLGVRSQSGRPRPRVHRQPCSTAAASRGARPAGAD